VAVTATVSGTTSTAVSILDFTLLPMHAGPGWNHNAPPSPAPTTGLG
jgi:hypothetical protein